MRYIKFLVIPLMALVISCTPGSDPWSKVITCNLKGRDTKTLISVDESNEYLSTMYVSTDTVLNEEKILGVKIWNYEIINPINGSIEYSFTPDTEDFYIYNPILSHSRTTLLIDNQKSLVMCSTTANETTVICEVDSTNKFYPSFSIDDSEILYNTSIDTVRVLMAYNINNATHRVVYKCIAAQLIQAKQVNESSYIGLLYNYASGYEMIAPLVLFNEQDGSVEVISNEDIVDLTFSAETGYIAYVSEGRELVGINLNTREELGRIDVNRRIYMSHPEFNTDGTKLVYSDYIVSFPEMIGKRVYCDANSQPHFSRDSSRLTTTLSNF